MTIHVRSRSGWYAVPDGHLHIRNSANQDAHGCYIRTSVGWHNSGYGGYPSTPGTPAIYMWDFNNIGISWSGGTGGAPVSKYIVERNDGTQWDVGSATSFTIGVTIDTEYWFRVYAGAASGLTSGPGSSLHVRIGHLSEPIYGFVWHTRPWNAHIKQTGFNRDNIAGVYIPSSVSINAIHWTNMRTPQSTELTEVDQRDIKWYLRGAESTAGDDPVGSISHDVPFLQSGRSLDYAGAGIGSENGGDAVWGVIPKGPGWTDSGVYDYMLLVDDLWFDGAEAYPIWDMVGHTVGQENASWV